MLRRAFDPLASRRLPRRVRQELRRRRADLHDGIGPGGAVSAGVRLVPLGELALGGTGAVALSGPVHVVGVFDLARCRNVATALETLVAARNVLGPGGRLDLVEPYRRTGRVWALAAALSPLWQQLFGLRLDLPLPALVREAGFTLAAVERFTMPTLFPPLRPFCSIVGLVPAGSMAPLDPIASQAATTRSVEVPR